eukprot:SAG11_NODE_3645_length_2315_cov_6.776625_3_plen_108_part_00
MTQILHSTATRAIRGYRGPLEAHHVAPMGAPTWALAPLWRTTTRLFGMPPGHFGRGGTFISFGRGGTFISFFKKKRSLAFLPLSYRGSRKPYGWIPLQLRAGRAYIY